MNRTKQIWPYLSAFLIAALTVIWISLLFPKGGRFQFEFQKGFVWSYPDLFAPFDLPVVKSLQEIEEEKIQIAGQVTPFYRADRGIKSEIEHEAEASFNRWFADAGPEDSLNLVKWELNQAWKALLTDLYNYPVGELRPEDRSKEAISLIMEDRTIRTIPSDRVVSLEQTREKISQWQPEGIEPRWSLPVKALLKEKIRSDLTFDEKETDRAVADAIGQVSDKRGLIRKGELIIPQGALVSDQHFQVLTSLKEQYASIGKTKGSQWWVFGGFLLLTMLIIGAYLLYLWNHHRMLLQQPRKLSFLFMWFFAFSYLVFAIENYTNLSSYIIPFCIVPIVVKNYFNERLAFFTHVVVILLASFLSNLGYEFTFLQILAGIVTVLTVRETREWAEFFKTLLLIFGAYVIGFTGLELIRNTGMENFDVMVLTWLSLNAFLTLLAYPLIPLLERIFGFISSITLVELCDMNRPLLKELSMSATGTFHHSLQVGNIAEDAANEIGANGLLVKTGALYHDIGKSKNPDYFIENQSGKNPHQDEAPEKSASVIIKHVTDGAEMARKAKLPKPLIRFILTHHGTTRVEYFFRKFIEAHPEADQDSTAKSFAYPGPKPVSKEECILMLADTLEAACKSLPEKNAESIDKLVDSMVEFKLKQGQFTEADITFAELESCKRSFKKSLKSIHHVRISYPDAPK